ncbi:MAG: InlB B-repeat-containing protein [Bacillus subtilis]|nr:InlB B-repeat-containing protein [Bacillus subtilis]
MTGSTFDGSLPVPIREGFAFEGWWLRRRFRNPLHDDRHRDLEHYLIRQTEPDVLCDYHRCERDVDDANRRSRRERRFARGARPNPVIRSPVGVLRWSMAQTNGNTNITAVQTITAVFQINTYTITFVADGATITTRTVNHGGTLANLPAVPEKTGMSGVWDVTDFSNITANMTVTAVYTNNIYTITYTNSVNATTSTVNVEHGTVFAAPTPAVIEGYDFVGWTGYDFLTPVTGAMTINAVYQIKTFTVVFYGVSGTQIGEIQTVVWGQAATAPTYSGETGYVFTGWNLGFSNVTSNLAVHATFTMVQYTIAFVENGGSAVADIVADYLSVIVAPGNPVRNGYVFDGWYSDELMTDEFVFTAQSTMPINGATLYAGWKADIFEVAFEPSNGTEIDPIEVTFGETFKHVAHAKQNRICVQRMVYKRWVNRPSCGLFDGVFRIERPRFVCFLGFETSDHLFQRQWWIRGFYHLPDHLPAMYPRRTLHRKSAIPLPDGYVDADLLTPYTFATMPADHLLPYAKWTINQYTITFDSNEGSAGRADYAKLRYRCRRSRGANAHRLYFRRLDKRRSVDHRLHVFHHACREPHVVRRMGGRHRHAIYRRLLHSRFDWRNLHQILIP